MTLRDFVKRWGSQEAAALELGFSQSQISFWLGGVYAPRKHTWIKLRANGITSIG